MVSSTKIVNTTAKFVKKNKVAIGTVVAGVVVGSYIDDSFEQNRYPVYLEYQIISECVHQSYSSRNSQNRINACICALERTMSEIEYSERESMPFSSTFERYLRRCL